MDPAAEIELEARDHQKPMNAVINLGDSPVQKFYEDTTIFMTGGSGFLGKQLIEKLFRACKIKKLYLLIRSKKGKSGQKRLAAVLEDPVFDLVREKQPKFAERIIPVDGDVAELRLGMCEKDLNTIAKEVDIIIHMAATVRFDEPLKVAAKINVRGTIEAVALAKSCTKLKQFIHVSTAYCQATKDRINEEVTEQFYPCAMPPDSLVNFVESLDEQRLNDITPELIKGWPNTYTFTKAIAEDVIRTSAADLPVCIVKPPIVTSCFYEPHPGWLDKSALGGPSGIILGISLGVIHVFFVDVDCKLATVPLDYVNNAIIGAGWDSAERRKDGNKEIPLYMVSNEEALVKWGFYSNSMNNECDRLYSPVALWYCYLIETKNKFVYWLLNWFLHYIPAYMLDGVCAIIGKRPKNIPSFVAVFQKINKLADAYSYFLTNSWKFRDTNVKAMIARMTANDRAIFSCDINNINYSKYTKLWVIGIRKYILKDGLQGSVMSAARQKWFGIGNLVFMALYIYGIFVVMSKIFSVVYYLFRFFSINSGWYVLFYFLLPINLAKLTLPAQ